MGAAHGLGVMGVVLVGAALVGGCGSNAALVAQREELEREHRLRMEELAGLEVRLLSLAATRREWAELGARHEEVSEVACTNAAEHLEGMERHYAWQGERARRLRAQKRLEEAAAKLSQVTLSSAPGKDGGAGN